MNDFPHKTEFVQPLYKANTKSEARTYSKRTNRINRKPKQKRHKLLFAQQKLISTINVKDLNSLHDQKSKQKLFIKHNSITPIVCNEVLIGGDTNQQRIVAPSGFKWYTYLVKQNLNNIMEDGQEEGIDCNNPVKNQQSTTLSTKMTVSNYLILALPGRAIFFNTQYQ